jgi:hypothetical protein
MVIKETPNKIEYRTKRGRLHRMDGPAVINKVRGTEEWWRNGRRHRLKGPAIYETNPGEDYEEQWFRKGKKHRVGGAAVTTYRTWNGVEKYQYWLLGEEYDHKEYKMVVRRSAIQKILELDKLEK